ncbi:MAG: hypothetical protein MPJ50_02985 [Pirellulales bacterium]|nr:hypothetical protein [Pirellulales bacterium]
MRRFRQFISAITYLLAIVVTVAVGTRVVYQMLGGEVSPSNRESSEFREYQESKAEKRKQDWVLLLQLANEDSENWTLQKQDRIIDSFTSWLDDGVSFDQYFSRLSNEQIGKMQENLVTLASRWLERRVAEYGSARKERDRKEIIREDTQRMIGLALMFGRLGGPFGRGLNRGINRLEEIKDSLLADEGYLSVKRLRLMAYVRNVRREIDKWEENGGWEKFIQQNNQF